MCLKYSLGVKRPWPSATKKILLVTSYHAPPSLFDLHFKRLCDFFLLEPLKKRFGDVITHGAREREVTTGTVIACLYCIYICYLSKKMPFLPLSLTVQFQLFPSLFDNQINLTASKPNPLISDNQRFFLGPGLGNS